MTSLYLYPFRSLGTYQPILSSGSAKCHVLTKAHGRIGAGALGSTSWDS